MRLRVGSVILTLALLIAGVVGGPGIGVVDAAMRADVQGLLDQGISLFKQGKLDEARSAFEKAMLLDPSSEEALEWVEQVGYHELVKALQAENDALSSVVGQILRLTYIETRNRSSDSSAIESALNEYFSSDDILGNYRLLHTSVSQHGMYLVPGCVERLAGDQEERVAAIRMLTKIKHDAVVPLTRALHHPTSEVVQGVIHALKIINDPGAVPSLKWVAQTHGDSVVRDRAQDAIRSIDPQSRQDGNAYDLLLAQAKRFYMNSSYMNLTYHDPVLWQLEEGMLTYTNVHPWSLNELRAEQLIEDARGLDPQGEVGNVLFTCNSVAQYTEYMSTRLVFERTGAEESQMAELLAEELQMKKVQARIFRMPDSLLYSALDQSLVDRRPEVAQEIIFALRDSLVEGERASAVSPVLLRAQDYDHRGVRFAASECVAYMNPSAGFDGATTAIENLSDGLVEAGARVALTIFPDEDDALRVRGLLNTSNVVAFNELDGFRGLHRAINFPPEDVILISDKVAGEMPTAEIISRLRKDPRTSDIPVVVVSDDASVAAAESVYGEMEKVVVVQRSIDGARLRDDILSPFFQDDTSERAQSIRVAARAAEALYFLASRDSVFDMSLAENALVSVLENRVDSVRIPACHAIGCLGTGRAENALVGICSEGQNGSASVDLYRAALHALGDVVKNRTALSATVKEALMQAGESSEPQIIKAAARAWGKSGRIQPAVLLSE